MKRKYSVSHLGMFVLTLVCVFIVSSSCKNQSKPSGGESDQTRVKSTDQTEMDSPGEQKTSPHDTSGMIYFEGGSFEMGNEQGAPDQQPAHKVEVGSFYIDKHPITVADFRRFIEATGYTTDADVFGDAGVFLLDQGRWNLVNGANWEYPQGPTQPKASDDHPVTQVSWRDARAYCDWAGKSLPTERQWEYAARNGGEIVARYPWGSNKPRPNGQHKANVWQGSLRQPRFDDGFKFTSPVGHYGEHPSGLTDMAGNVWEWCRTVYHAYPGSQTPVTKNSKVRVIRGGSFFYDEAGEDSYTVTYRSKNTTETSLFNLGFRCVVSKGD